MLGKRVNTIVVTVRMDVRDFATLVEYYLRTEEVPPRSCSTFFRIGIQDLVLSLIKSGKAKEFKTITEANDYIEDTGVRKQAVSARVGRRLIEHLDLEKAAEDRQSSESSMGDSEPKLTPSEVLRRMREGK